MAAPALIAIGAGVQAIGAIHESQATAAAADYNANVDQQNADLARQQGMEEERRARVYSSKVIGEQRVAIGGSGVQVDGSALDVLQESASNAELDALTIRHGAAVKAYQFENEARAEKFRAKTARMSGYISAASAILSGGGKIANGVSKSAPKDGG